MRQRNDRSAMNRGGAAIIEVAAGIIAAVAGGVLATAPAYAQRDRALEVDVAECLEIESPAERFRCYESRVDEALDEAPPSEPEAARAARPAESSPPAAAESERTDRPSASSAPSVLSAPSAPPAAVISEREIEPEQSADADGFGLRRSAREDRREREEKRDQREELFGTVAAIRETVPNSHIITLENGQVWRQVRPSFYPLRPGHRVRIYSTNWGDSYRMSAEELNGFIQVERIR